MISNDLFDAIKCATEAEYQVLLAEKRIFSTLAWFNGTDAKNVVGGSDPAEYYAPDIRPYGGNIITTRSGDWQEALWQAKLRGFGEKIVGILEDIVAWQTELKQTNFN